MTVKITQGKGIISIWFVNKYLVIELRLPIYVWRTAGKDRRKALKDRRQK